jgi:hypothetical protein
MATIKKFMRTALVLIAVLLVTQASISLAHPPCMVHGNGPYHPKAYYWNGHCHNYYAPPPLRYRKNIVPTHGYVRPYAW